MKRSLLLTLMFAFILPLVSCSHIPTDGDNPIQPPQEMTSIQTTSEENTPQLSSQDLAQRAYGQILDCFGGLLPHDPGYPGYPAEFGNAYYEDGCIVVCLTDISQEMQEKYLSLVDTPEILRFREVDYSYNDLYALQEAISSTQGLHFTSIGVDVMENRVVVGIPDITQEAQALTLILDQLPQDVSGRFSECPIVFQQEECVQLS